MFEKSDSIWGSRPPKREWTRCDNCNKFIDRNNCYKEEIGQGLYNYFCDEECHEKYNGITI